VTPAAWSDGAVTPPRPAARRLEPEPPPPVRPAEPRDVARIAATLTLSAATARWTRWALPEDGRVQRLTRWHELAAHGAVATRTGWVSEEVTSVALWRPPDGAPGTAPLPADVREALARELPYLSGHRAPVVTDTDRLVAAHLPDGPHWQLLQLATRPTARRRGLGSAVLAPALARCDEDGVPAAAVAWSWAAAGYLRSEGFEVTAKLETADGAMPVWVLVRRPG
jgi:ribosomal protein S18 acetylase RimI-like enzyme